MILHCYTIVASTKRWKIKKIQTGSFALLKYSHRHFDIEEFSWLWGHKTIHSSAAVYFIFGCLFLFYETRRISIVIIQWPRHAKSVIPLKFFSLFILLIKCKILKSFSCFMPNDDDGLWHKYMALCDFLRGSNWKCLWNGKFFRYRKYFRLEFITRNFLVVRKLYE